MQSRENPPRPPAATSACPYAQAIHRAGPPAPLRLWGGGFDGGLRAPLPLEDKGFPQKNAGNGGFFVRKTTGRTGS